VNQLLQLLESLAIKQAEAKAAAAAANAAAQAATLEMSQEITRVAKAIVKSYPGFAESLTVELVHVLGWRLE